MRFVLGVAGIFTVSLFAAEQAAAVRLTKYPNMGNVQPGCSGVSRCIIYVAGAGSSTTDADVQQDLITLTANMPPGVGIVAYKASGALYSSSDIAQLKGDVHTYSSQFGYDLATVCVSDGARAVMDAQGSYSRSVGPLGPLVIIDQFSPRPFAIPDTDPAIPFDVIVRYTANYGPQIRHEDNTGPITTPYQGNSSVFQIILNAGPEEDDPEAFLAIKSVHEATINSGKVTANATLVAYLLGGLPRMTAVLQAQLTAAYQPPPTDTGEPGVSAPQQGNGSTTPTQGGGIGMESFPTWLRCKEARQHVPACKP
jgi:type 1 fimbria pilin